MRWPQLLLADTRAKVGDHLSIEITVPGFAAPLYFLGEVVRAEKRATGYEVACRFDVVGFRSRQSRSGAASG